MHPIRSEDHNLAEIAAELGSRLIRFNEALAGPLRTRYMALTVRDDHGAIVAGLTGEVFWNALNVHLLWVDEDYRLQGSGTLLLHRAEELSTCTGREPARRPACPPSTETADAH